MKNFKFTQEEVEILGYAMNFNLDELERDVVVMSKDGFKSETFIEILKMRNILEKLGVEREQC
jgi:hypothetical protein